MNLKESVAKHTIFNFVGYVLPILITLLTVPLYIDQIGDARYGVLSLVWLVLGYFGLFDFGLGKAVSNQIAYYRGKQRKHEGIINDIFWTSSFLNVVLGLFGGAVLYFLGPVILNFFTDIKTDFVQEVLEILPVLSFAVPVVTVTSVGNGFLEGKEEFGILNSLKILRDFSFQVFPLAVSYLYGPQLVYLICAAIAAKLFTSFVQFGYIFLKRFVNRPTVRIDLVSLLFSYGGYVTVSNVIGPILVSIDRFIIGAISGAKAVTYYAIPFSITKKITIITSSLSLSLFPKFSSLDKQDALSIANKALIFLISILTPLVILAMILLEPFLNIWIGPEIAEKSTSVGLILFMGVWINNLAKIPHTLLYGQKRPKIVAMFHSLELLPYLAVLWVMITYWGVEGAAFAWTLRVSADAFLLSKAAGLFQTSLRSVIGYPFLLISTFVLLYMNTIMSSNSYIYIALAIILFVITIGYSFYTSHNKIVYLGKYFYKNLYQLLGDKR